MTDTNDRTLAGYQQAAGRYIEQSGPPVPAVAALLDRVARAVGPGRVLEIGTGPGWDADYLETRGVRVLRTDATPAFVDHLLRAGHAARLLDVRTGDLGGPYDGVLADVVLLHLTREELELALGRLRGAVTDGGTLALTLKEGDGEGWTTVRLDVPRYFTFWREDPLRDVLHRTGWEPVEIDQVSGPREPWLHVLATAAPRS